MTGATLTRGRCAPLDGLRPCQVRNPDWWVTGNENNATAIMLCQTACRFAAQCPADNPTPDGMIVAGVPHNDAGRALKVCAKCNHPWVRRSGRGGATCMCRTAAHHHKLIMAMRKREASWVAIGTATGLHPKTIKAYCQEVNARRTAERLARSGAGVIPSEHRDRIVNLRKQGHTWLQVAEEIGCTPWALKGYVKRQRDRGLIAA
jgi:hypothetical protein